MVEIPHGVSFEEKQQNLLQRKSRPSRLARFLSSITKGKVTDTKPFFLTLTFIVVAILFLYLISLLNLKNEANRLVAPAGYKVIYPKDAPPHLEITNNL